MFSFILAIRILHLCWSLLYLREPRGSQPCGSSALCLSCLCPVCRFCQFIGTWSIIVTEKMWKNSFSLPPQWTCHWVCLWQKTCWQWLCKINTPLSCAEQSSSMWNPDSASSASEWEKRCSFLKDSCLFQPKSGIIVRPPRKEKAQTWTLNLSLLTRSFLLLV